MGVDVNCRADATGFVLLLCVVICLLKLVILKIILNFIFSQFSQYDQELSGSIGLSPKPGDIFEIYIHDTLNIFFGADKVNKINSADERADFYIDLQSCDIIVESKIGLGKCQSQSLMTPNILLFLQSIYHSLKPIVQPLGRRLCRIVSSFEHLLR